MFAKQQPKAKPNITVVITEVQRDYWVIILTKTFIYWADMTNKSITLALLG